jgi:hypothetical protein
VVQTAGTPTALVLSGTTAYITNQRGETNLGVLQVFDLQEATSPRLLNTSQSPGLSGTAISANPVGLAVSGATLYVVSQPASTNAGLLQVLDVSNPASPSLLLGTTSAGGLRLAANPVRVAVSGTTVFVLAQPTATAGSLQAFDVSDPRKPRLLSTVATYAAPVDLRVQGAIALVVTQTNSNEGNMQLFEVSNPAAPVLLNPRTCPSCQDGRTAAYPISLAVSGTRVAVVARGEARNTPSAGVLQLFDISSPAAPVLLNPAQAGGNTGGTAINANPVGVEANGTMAYVLYQAAGKDGITKPGALQVFDLSDPTSPVALNPAGANAITTDIIPVALKVEDGLVCVLSQPNRTTGTLQLFDSPLGRGRVVAVNPDGSLASVAATALPGDNLGNHRATQQLVLASSGLRFGNGSTQTTAAVSDNLGSHTATQNLDLATYQLVGQGGSQGLSLTNTGMLQLNSGDQDKIYLTSQGATGSKLGHATGWGLLSYAGPGTGNQGYHAWLLSGASAYQEGMRLTTTGLGIGTSTPAAKLDVQGDANISGTLSLGVVNVTAYYSIQSYTSTAYTINCPSGTYLLTGGGGHRQTNAAQQSVFVNYSGPDENNPTTTWTLRVTNTASTPRDIYLNCNCARLR